MHVDLSTQDGQQAERYLLVLSILLGISVLKITEVLTLGGTLKAILADAQRTGFTSSAVGIFLVVAAYLVFFALVLLSVIGVGCQLRGQPVPTGNVGKLIAMCIGALGIAYAGALSFTIYGLSVP